MMLRCWLLGATAAVAHGAWIQQVRLPQASLCVARRRDSGSLCMTETGDMLLEGAKAVRAHNAEALPLLQDLRARTFFRLYSVDLLASCSYMPSEEVRRPSHPTLVRCPKLRSVRSVA